MEHNFIKNIQNVDPITSVGKYPTFVQTPYISALIGAVVGTTASFKNSSSNMNFFYRPKENRFKKILLVNLWMIVVITVSVLVGSEAGGQYVANLGLNVYITINMISFFALYVAMGPIPTYLLDCLHIKSKDGLSEASESGLST